MFAKYKNNVSSLRRYYSTTFENLGISSATCQKLKSGFNVTQPTHAQEQFIPTLVAGQRDILLRDHTGTGKTFGTALTLASLIPTHTKHHKSIHSLYIVPNQELACQIGHWIQDLSSSDHIQILSNANDPYDASHVPHTAVGTPGRILDLLSQGQLPLHALERLIVDEADQAFSLPKRYATVRQQQKRAVHPKPAEQLLDQIPKLNRHQTVMSSATLNRPLRYFLTHQKQWMHDPLFVDLSHGSQLSNDRNATVRHHCLVISDDCIRNIHTQKSEIASRDKQVDFDDLDDRMMESLAILQDIEPVHNGILFVGSTVSVASVKKKLAEHDVDAEDIQHYNHHGKNKKSLWIATEFTARGIDIPQVSHVFILGKPASVTSYLHMAGRTGRLSPAGFAKGKVISLVREHGWTESKMVDMYELLNVPAELYEHVS